MCVLLIVKYSAATIIFSVKLSFRQLLALALILVSTNLTKLTSESVFPLYFYFWFGLFQLHLI